MADTSQTRNQVPFKLFELVITDAMITARKIAYRGKNTGGYISL